jgi:hypothetical protein
MGGLWMAHCGFHMHSTVQYTGVLKIYIYSMQAPGRALVSVRFFPASRSWRWIWSLNKHAGAYVRMQAWG